MYKAFKKRNQKQIIKTKGNEKMAQTNQLILCGIQQRDTRVSTSGDYASIILKTIVGARYDGDESRYKYIYVLVISRDTEIIKEMATSGENDLILVKGVVVSREVQKISACPACATENIKPGNVTYCEPIHFEVLKKGIDAEDINSTLLAHREISNIARIVGNACTDIREFTDKKNRKSVKYCIAVPRTYRIKNSSESERTDFVTAHSYGDNATDDATYVKKRDKVLIDGYLQHFIKKVSIDCACCGRKYEFEDGRMEVIPFETEYFPAKEKLDEADAAALKDAENAGASIELAG